MNKEKIAWLKRLLCIVGFHRYEYFQTNGGDGGRKNIDVLETYKCKRCGRCYDDFEELGIDR